MKYITKVESNKFKELSKKEKHEEFLSQFNNSEHATWELQKTQANEYIENRDESKAAFIVSLAKANSMTPLQFSRLVVSKVKAYEGFLARSLGKKQKDIKDLEISK